MTTESDLKFEESSPCGYSFTDYQLDIDDFAQYPEVGTGSTIALLYVGLGLGETGEVQGKLKKVLRDDGGIVTDEKRTEVGKELGDVLWYLTRVADELGLSLEQIAQENVAKLRSRLERGVIQGSGDNR